MTHAKESLTETINLKVEKNLDDFLAILSDKNPKSDFCKTKIVTFFMKYGIWTFFMEDCEYDLSNFKDTVKLLKRVTNGGKFENIINKVNAYKEMVK